MRWSVRPFAMLAAVLFSSPALAQTANDLVHAWLAQNGKVEALGDYQTCDPAPAPAIGSDGICTWNAAKLGAQPTAAQLQALAPVVVLRQQAEQFSSIVSAGVVATSPSTPALNATYAADDATQARLSAIVAGIAAGQGLPGGGVTFLHPDISGAPHAFTAAQIVALAKFTRDFIYGATLARGALLSGQAASWPSNQVQLP